MMDVYLFRQYEFLRITYNYYNKLEINVVLSGKLRRKHIKRMRHMDGSIRVFVYAKAHAQELKARNNSN